MPDLVKMRGLEYLGARQQLKRVIVAGARADGAIERGHGLEIVVEHVRPRFHHAFERALLAQEVGDQHLDGRCRRRVPDGANGGGEMPGAAVVEIVAVDRGHHHMGKAELGHRVADARGLRRIERRRPARAHIAEGASPRAGVAHDHDGRVALAPALADIGTGRLLAHGGEAVRAQGGARRIESAQARRAHADPGGLGQHWRVGPMRLFGMARPRLACHAFEHRSPRSAVRRSRPQVAGCRTLRHTHSTRMAPMEATIRLPSQP